MLVSFAGLEYPVLRFLGFAVINAVSATLWSIMIRNAINNKISGDELTNWDSFSTSLQLYGSLFGAIIALIWSDRFDVETCILLQCMSNMIVGVGDLKAFRRLND